MYVDIGDIVTASRAFHYRLASEVEQWLVLPSKRRPEDVNFGRLDVTWAAVLHLRRMLQDWSIFEDWLAQLFMYVSTEQSFKIKVPGRYG